MARDTILIIILGAIALVLQLVLAPNIAIAGAMPNFILGLVIALAVARVDLDLSVPALVLGLLYALICGGTVGFMAILLIVGAFLARHAFAVLNNDTPFMPVTIMFIVMLLIELVYTIVYVMSTGAVGLVDGLLMRCLPCFLYDCLVGFIFYFVISKLSAGGAGPSGGRPTATTIESVGLR